MTNLMTKPTQLSLYLVEAYVGPGDVVVDATAGNGWDTLALAQKVGPEGKVYAFDVQESAIRQTALLLQDQEVRARCLLIQDTHQELKKYLQEKEHGQVSAVLFNLGYLPGGDKSVTTETESTLKAVAAALEIIKRDGIVAITVYSGHPSGKREKDALLSFAEALPSREFHVMMVSYPNQLKNPPELLLITKK